jgi:hypothetical protein
MGLEIASHGGLVRQDVRLEPGNALDVIVHHIGPPLLRRFSFL